jgi:hypothetical protein
VEKIDQQSKSIQQLQNKTHILYEMKNHPELLEKEYKGVILDVEENATAIYFPRWKWVTWKKRIAEDPAFHPGDTHLFKLFYFEDQERFQKKIRIQTCV